MGWMMKKDGVTEVVVLTTRPMTFVVLPVASALSVFSGPDELEQTLVLTHSGSTLSGRQG